MGKVASVPELFELEQKMGRQQWRLVSDVAQVVANYLRCHPQVQVVRYPGLKADPQYAEASHTLVGGFGPAVWYCVAGEWHELRCEPCDPRDLVMQLESQLRSV